MNKKIKEFGIVDVIVWFIFAIVCFFSFQQGDILHTAGSSFGYLNGHFWDFYDWNKQYLTVDAYMPTTYIMFAIWNIPLRLLKLVTVPTMSVSVGVLMWYKLFPVLLYLVCAYIIYKICKQVGLEDKKARIGSYVFVTCPIGFFSQFIFGQYDVFTVLFMLLGYYYYLKENDKLFILYFGIAITCKYFALLFFLPLLLLRQKNIFKIVWMMLCVGVPFALEMLFYIHSSAFKEGVFGFNATSYIFNASIDTGYYKISIVVMLWVALCVVAHLKDSENVFVDSLFILNLAVFICFGLSMWHPQWLLLAVPFMSLGVVVSKKNDVLLLLELILTCLYCMFTVNMWTNHVDQTLLFNGVLKGFIKHPIGEGSSINMSMLYVIKNKDLIMSFFSGCLLALTILKMPRYMTVDDAQISIDKKIWYIRARFVLGTLFFIVPAFVCFFVAC